MRDPIHRQRLNVYNELGVINSKQLPAPKQIRADI